MLHDLENKVLILPSDSEPFRQVILQNYILQRGGCSKEYWHGLVIQHFLTEPNSLRKLEELPWHLQICKKWWEIDHDDDDCDDDRDDDNSDGDGSDSDDDDDGDDDSVDDDRDCDDHDDDHDDNGFDKNVDDDDVIWYPFLPSSVGMLSEMCWWTSEPSTSCPLRLRAV